MRKTIAFAVAGAIAFLASPALAGLVITQEQSVNAGQHARTNHQTIMVQGNKQKIVDERRSVIIDLDTGKQVVLLPAAKTYFESAFMRRGPMGSMMQRRVGGAMEFKKTGKTRTVAGYKCDDYEATGQSMSGEYTTTQCLSTSVPGSGEYSAFQNAMLEKLKGTTPEIKGLPTDAIPLASDTTIKLASRMRRGAEGGQGGGQAGGAAQAAPERPPVVIHTEVTKIAKQDLPADTFAVPADYKLGNMTPPQTGMGMSAAQGSPAAAPSAAPSPAAKAPGN